MPGLCSLKQSRLHIIWLRPRAFGRCELPVGKQPDGDDALPFRIGDNCEGQLSRSVFFGNEASLTKERMVSLASTCADLLEG